MNKRHLILMLQRERAPQLNTRQLKLYLLLVASSEEDGAGVIPIKIIQAALGPSCTESIILTTFNALACFGLAEFSWPPVEPAGFHRGVSYRLSGNCGKAEEDDDA